MCIHLDEKGYVICMCVSSGVQVDETRASLSGEQLVGDEGLFVACLQQNIG